MLRTVPQVYSETRLDLRQPAGRSAEGELMNMDLPENETYRLADRYSP